MQIRLILNRRLKAHGSDSSEVNKMFLPGVIVLRVMNYLKTEDLEKHAIEANLISAIKCCDCPYLRWVGEQET